MEWIPASHWEEHPRFPAGDWAQEALNDDTRLGYVAWVNNHLEQEEG
ncbi:MAG: hypothetical protein J3T61_11010 [Candidatus Brocadiales bacterium]|nr:hypothetical protein [Candidatus Bathyanammoxibius sp.]